MNNVHLIGVLVGDPVFFPAKGDTKQDCLILKLKTTKAATTLSSGKVIPEKSTLHRVVAFGEKGRDLNGVLKHNTLVSVLGELNYSSRQDEFGNTTNSTQILLRSCETLAQF